MVKNRESNFELMRIISMLLIVLFHVLSYSGYLAKATGFMLYFLLLIKSITLMHVNSFILLSGYFQNNSKMKLSKMVSLNNETWFYKSLIAIIFLIFNLYQTIPTKTEILQNLLPIDFGIYWFIGAYIVLYLISPILNKSIKHFSKKEHKSIIIIIIFILSFLCLITVDTFYNNNFGRSLSTFVLLYFIGAYMNKYPIEKNKYVKQMTIKRKKAYCLSTILICSIIGSTIGLISLKISGISSILDYISRMLCYFSTSYSSPIVLIQSIAYFIFFKTIKINSQFINKVASCVFGVYLIHENKYVREILYNKIGLTTIKTINIKSILYLLIVVIIIFIICIIIEFIRKIIFKFFYNLNISSKMRKKISQFVEKKLSLTW